MTTKRVILFATVLLLLSSTAAMAQPDKPWKSIFGNFAVGYTIPQGDAGDILDSGWNLLGGVTYRPQEWPMGVWGELSWQENDIKRSILNQIDSSGGDMEMWSLTGGGMWATQNQGPVDFGISFGTGWYHRRLRLTEPGVGWQPGFCGWYWCQPGGWYPTNVTTGSDTQDKIGGNLGLTLSFNLPNDSQIYVEVKYHYVDTDPGPTEYLPINLGYRW